LHEIMSNCFANVRFSQLLRLMTVALLTGFGAVSAAPVLTESRADWRLSEVRVTDTGHQNREADGSTSREYILEARAQAEAAAPIPAGSLRVTFTVRAPQASADPSAAQIWRLRGRWVLTDDRSVAPSQRNAPGTMGGLLHAELATDPTQGSDPWSGLVQIPPTRFIPFDTTVPQPVRGQGALNLVPQGHHGTLSLSLKL
jgi:hypothetical protein